MSKAARNHMDKVAQLPCVICLYKLGVETRPVHVHHDTVPADDFAVAALCPEHHQGSTGVHGLHRRAFKAMWRLTDTDLLAMTNRAIAEGR
ncbi:hypothetical protein SAMN05216420_101381 [Nitrosospira sp. Nl5]|nr:hypothetical protein SAMN05216420_101381 [Nitrosospira sp. Nl5]